MILQDKRQSHCAKLKFGTSDKLSGFPYKENGIQQDDSLYAY